MSKVYTPPCWVNPGLQKKLLTSSAELKIKELGLELWEASGGEEIGFQEFKKFAKKPGSPLKLSNDQFQDIWRSFGSKEEYDTSFAFSSRQTSRTVKSPPGPKRETSKYPPGFGPSVVINTAKKETPREMEVILAIRKMFGIHPSGLQRCLNIFFVLSNKNIYLKKLR